MASPRARASPLSAGAAQPLASRALNVSKSPANGGTPLGEEAIWKRLRDAGLDEETLKKRDKAALIAYITKLESEIYGYQHHMGLLIMERKEWTSKYEQLKASSESVEIEYKHEHAAHLSALAEARKQEQSLKKALGIEKECIANIEKALHDMRAESAERKLAYESKITEARELMEAAQQRFDEAEKKLVVAESLETEANRKHSSALRTLEDIETREDDLRRRLVSFKSECDAKEIEIITQRQALHDSQKILHEEQERLLQGQILLNQREVYILERVKELNLLETELEDTKARLEEENKVLKMERSSLEQEIAALASREEAIVNRESLLDKKECELLILQEKITSKELDEIQKVTAKHQCLLERKRSEFELEIEKKRLLFEEEREARRKACEVREADILDKEKDVQQREQAVKFKQSMLAEKEENLTNKLRSLEEKEQNLCSIRKETELEIQNLQKERENILVMKLDLEKTEATLEDEKKEILRLTFERNELLVLETKLKEEIDSFRAQKMAVVAEADELRAQKERLEANWESFDEERKELKKEAELIDEEREAVAQFLKNELESIKLEKDSLRSQFKSDVESLSREREEFIREMDRQHSDWFSKVQQEREEFMRDINVQRNELENCISKRREEIETYLREREEAFEQEKAKEIQHINFQKQMIAREMEHVTSEMQKLENERTEIAIDRERRETEWAEIKSSIEALNVQREKLQKQRELLHADREEIYQQIQRLKALEGLNLEFESKSLSDMQSKKLKVPAKRILKKSIAHCNNGADKHISAVNGGSTVELCPQNTSNSSPSPSGTKSWIRKCANMIFRNSPEEKPGFNLEKNVEGKISAEFKKARSLEPGSQVCKNFGDDNRHLSNGQDKAGLTDYNSVSTGLHEFSPLTENAQSPSKVEVNGSGKELSELEDPGKKSRNLVGGVNSWLLGRKRSNNMLSHDPADAELEPSQKQQKRARQNGVTVVEGDPSNCTASTTRTQTGYLGDEGQPSLSHQALQCGDLHVGSKDQEDERKLAISDTYRMFKGEQVLDRVLNVSASKLIAEDKKLEELEEYSQDIDDELDESEGRMSLKAKLWNFLIT